MCLCLREGGKGGWIGGRERGGEGRGGREGTGDGLIFLFLFLIGAPRYV